MAKKPDPLPLVKDTREPKDKYTWASKFYQARVKLDVRYIKQGDYSIGPCVDEAGNLIPGGAVIERKKVSDFITTVRTKEMRERFLREWEAIDDSIFKVLMLEGERALSQIIAHQFRGKFDEDAAVSTLVNWGQKQHYHIWQVNDSIEGERMMFWFFSGFHRKLIAGAKARMRRKGNDRERK